VLGTPPALSRRALNMGEDVNADERIETFEICEGQFIFLDHTTHNVWPNSDIVLDRFVYELDANSGDIIISMTRGFLRFIGGRISKGNDAQVRTPPDRVFIRGGIAQVMVRADVTRVIHLAGGIHPTQ
jgi:hypothetical protein